jgi:hypothetical protein
MKKEAKPTTCPPSHKGDHLTGGRHAKAARKHERQARGRPKVNRGKQELGK